MFPFVRPRLTVLLGATVGLGAAAIAGVLLLAGGHFRGMEAGDPDPDTGSQVSICSDVPVHAWVTVNIGTVARPDIRKVDYDVKATGHDRDPFSRTLAKACDMAAGAFGSRVVLKAPGLNKDWPFPVTAPTDRRHVLVVRLTRHDDGTVTSSQKLIPAP
ncbi:hypothetical protein ACH4B4_41735 [Streptomyces tendae]